MRASRFLLSFYQLCAVFLGIATVVLLRGGGAFAIYFLVPAAVTFLAGTIVALRAKRARPAGPR